MNRKIKIETIYIRVTYVVRYVSAAEQTLG